MNSKHTESCHELQTRFEGREAIYVEKGALRVRVSDIRISGGFHIAAEVQEIPTPGLERSLFHARAGQRQRPLRWRIGAGYLTAFGEQSWKAGYGGWALYFSPDVVEAVVSLAARFPEDIPPHDAYRQVSHLLMDLRVHQGPEKYVFADTVENGTGRFQPSDASPITVPVTADWVICPCCDMRFKLSDAHRWDGERHTTCGQRLIVAG